LKHALISSLRHTATALAGAFTALQFDASADFARKAAIAAGAAAFAGVIRFLTLVGEPETPQADA
jgi:hypothetical protein